MPQHTEYFFFSIAQLLKIVVCLLLLFFYSFDCPFTVRCFPGEVCVYIACTKVLLAVASVTCKSNRKQHGFHKFSCFKLQIWNALPVSVKHCAALFFFFFFFQNQS